MSSPRILTIMGSGETTPTMVRVHRALLDRLSAELGVRPVPSALLDTPYGFQENADDITARALEYFRDSVGHPLSVASLRGDEDGVARETAMARIREAAYVFSGPGSPTYALRAWAGPLPQVPRLLAAKLDPGGSGGAITFASAAAITLGRFALPVYEIYKAGEPAHWLPGLDVLSAIGLPVAVVPHYDNAEGGNHDTRFCFMGERRLRLLEAKLPDDTFILGVDGHTALVLDLDAETAEVHGLGSVTVRRRGESVVFESGSKLTLDDICPDRSLATRRDTAEVPAAEDGGRPAPGVAESAPGSESAPLHPLRATVRDAELAFRAGLDAGDVQAAVGEILALDGRILEWSRDTEESSELDDARAALRSMIVRLGDAAVEGLRDPAERIAPFVEALVELRLRARSDADWRTADAIRTRLVAAGVELHDSPDGTSWELHPPEPVR